MSEPVQNVKYVIDPPVIPSLPVWESEARFPVHRVYCVGRNYADHAIEMGHDPQREQPFFFQKNPDSVLVSDGTFAYPPASEEVHHEVEMVIAIGRGGQDIAAEQARNHIYGYAVGIDMTRRDLQAQLKKKGLPWEAAKAFEGAAPCSAVFPAIAIGHPERGEISLEINGVRRQTGDLEQMIWKVPEIIAHLSRLFTLQPGDLIFSGTPAGVGSVRRGDNLLGSVAGVGELRLQIV